MRATMKIVRKEKPSGKTFIAMRITVGDYHVDISPNNWDELVTDGNNLHNEALDQLDDEVEKARALWEQSNNGQ